MNNYGQDSVILGLINDENVETKVESCIFENNTSLNNLFNVQTANLLMIDLTFINNQGRVLTGLDFIGIFISYNLLDHSCLITSFEGCVAYLETSNIYISNFSVFNLTSLFINDLISLTYSEIVIDNIYLKNIKTISSTLLLNGKDSAIVLQNSLFENLNQSLIYLQENSNLSIFSSNFSRFFINQGDLSLITCELCDKIILKSNFFIECNSKSNAGSLSLVSGHNNMNFNFLIKFKEQKTIPQLKTMCFLWVQVYMEESFIFKIKMSYFLIIHFK